MLEHDDVCNFKIGEKRATSFLGSSPYLEIVDPGNEVEEIPKWLKKIIIIIIIIIFIYIALFLLRNQ